MIVVITISIKIKIENRSNFVLCNEPIYMKWNIYMKHWSFSKPHEKIKNTSVFLCFQIIQKKAGGINWVKFNIENIGTKFEDKCSLIRQFVIQSLD